MPNMPKPIPRTCANCACSAIIEPPRIATAERAAAPPDAKPHWFCRWNPPYAVQYPSPDGKQMLTGIVQSPTTADTVCWQWKPEGTLPGDGAKSLFETVMG